MFNRVAWGFELSSNSMPAVCRLTSVVLIALANSRITTTQKPVGWIEVSRSREAPLYLKHSVNNEVQVKCPIWYPRLDRRSAKNCYGPIRASSRSALAIRLFVNARLLAPQDLGLDGSLVVFPYLYPLLPLTAECFWYQECPPFCHSRPKLALA